MKSTFVFDGSIYVLDIVLFKKKKKKSISLYPLFFWDDVLFQAAVALPGSFVAERGGCPETFPLRSIVYSSESVTVNRYDLHALLFFLSFFLMLKFQKFPLFRNYYWLAKFIDVFFIILTRKSLQPVYSTCVSFDHVVSLTPFFFPFSECLPVIQQRCWNRPSGSFPSSF